MSNNITTKHNESKIMEEPIMKNIIYINNVDYIFLNPDSVSALPIKGAFSVEGIYCCYNEETMNLEPDFDVTVFYLDGETDAHNYICFGDDAPEIAYDKLKDIIAKAVRGDYDFDRTIWEE